MIEIIPHSIDRMADANIIEFGKVTLCVGSSLEFMKQAII